MVNENVVEIINEQINKEFYSGYLYLSMAGYFCGMNFQGFANFTQEYSKKKIELGLKLFNNLIIRKVTVNLYQIKTPDREFNNPLDVFLRMSDNEQMLTDSIMNAIKPVERDNDRQTLSLIDCYIKDQEKELTELQYLISKLKYFKNDDSILYLLDREFRR